MRKSGSLGKSRLGQAIEDRATGGELGIRLVEGDMVIHRGGGQQERSEGGKEEGSWKGSWREGFRRRGEKRWDIHWICINWRRPGRRARERTAAEDKAIQACQNPAARPVIYDDPQSRLPSKSSVQKPFVHSRHTQLSLTKHTPTSPNTVISNCILHPPKSD